MEIFTQFLLRLAFGLAVGMAITSPRQVSSGYFRNHLYVTLGLATLALLVPTRVEIAAAGLTLLAALSSFIGAACWLYEAKRLGLIFVWAVAGCSLLAATWGRNLDFIHIASFVSSGLVLGITLAAMLLGHWYLNAPGMSLAPLRRLLAAAAIAVSIQALISGIGVIALLSPETDTSIDIFLFIVLRWSFGICGVLALLWMAWRTLQIPNTQSATGILYVAVIGVFVGELTAALLSAHSLFPL